MVLFAAQPKQLFNVYALPELPKAQEERLNRILKEKSTVKMLAIVSLRKDWDKETSPLMVFPLKSLPLQIKDYKITPTKSVKLLAWTGNKSEVILSVRIYNETKQSVTGLIWYDNKVYAVEPLGEGFNVIVEVDQVKFPKK